LRSWVLLSTGSTYLTRLGGWVCVVFWASIWWFCDWSLISKVSWDLLLMYNGAGWDVLLLRLNP
jgi:hypothetical protein